MEKVSELARQARFWGLRGLVRSIHYSLLGEWGKLRQERPREPFEPVGRLLGVEQTENGAHISFERAELEVRFLLPDLVRLTWQPGVLPVPYGLAREQWPDVEVEVLETEDGWEIVTDRLRLSISRSGRLSFFDAAGKLLREELSPARRGEEWVHRAPLREDERLYGLGEHTGPLDLRGSRRRLWNTDPMTSYGPDQAQLYLNIPVYQSLHGEGSYLLFYENSYPATLGYEEEIQAHFEGGALRYYFVPGPPDRALQSYTKLTGRPPLPPRWALGYHQSRFSYATEEEVREVAEGFESRDLPLDAIHLDIHYMDGYRVFTVDEKRFPDLSRLARDLDAQGVRLVAILDPGIKRDSGYPLYREALEKDMLCRTKGGKVAVAPVWPGWCAFPDFTSPLVRDWWAGQYQKLVEPGIAGFWNDMNEPAVAALWGERSLARDVEHELEGRGGTHYEAHNLYGLLMARSGYEAQRRLRPERRPFLLSRSGWAGIQRYAWTWTGDISGSWAMLRQTIATVVGLGLSGVPYSGPDIGGFKGIIDEELYLRWFELATFLPFFRTHSALGMPRREPWSFGPEVLEHVRDLLNLRTQLMPYLYTLAWEAHRRGHPLVRPLFWLDSEDPALQGTEDMFLLGDALLVAPVLQKGERRRSLTLPPGRWYGFWDNVPREGKVEVEAPPGHPPLFVRQGTVLPLTEGENLMLCLYPPNTDDRDGGQLYSDAGDGYGAHRIDRFEMTSNNGSVRLEWKKEGDYPFPYDEVVVRLPGLGVQQARVDGRGVAVSGARIEAGLFSELSLTLSGIPDMPY